MSANIVLADTNVLSELVKATPDAQVMRWLESVQGMALSAITLEEAHFGLAWQPNARKLALFNALVERMFAVYPITPAIAHRGGCASRPVTAAGAADSAPTVLRVSWAAGHRHWLRFAAVPVRA